MQPRRFAILGALAIVIALLGLARLNTRPRVAPAAREPADAGAGGTTVRYVVGLPFKQASPGDVPATLGPAPNIVGNLGAACCGC